MLAQFGTWNAAPASFYTEGASSDYPTAGAVPGRDGVNSFVNATEGFTWSLDSFHFSNNYLVFTPRQDLGPTTQLNISINFPFPPGVGAATALVFSPAGISVVPIPLDGNGDALPTPVQFDPTVSKVVVVITNAGNRFICNQDLIFSCSGLPLDDWLNSEFVITAQAS
jgi:hypothetical protein